MRKNILLVALFMLYSVSTFAQKIGGTIISAPILPQVVPSVIYPSEAGYTITAVAGGANLQTAITAATCGTILSLAHNGSWTTGTAYTLPATTCACHTDSTKWIILRSDAFVGGSTRGVRADPSSEYTNYAHISSTDANYGITALANGDSCYWLGPGLDVSDATDANTAIVTFGDGTQTVANYPHDFIIDHSYIHGLPTIGTSRCVSIDGNFESVVDSYLSDCHKVGQDAQAILIRDGKGGFLIQNNFLSGSGENILTGGVDPQPGIVMADYTIQNNHFFKPLSWRREDPTYAGIHWSIKNILESKVSQRVVVFGNVLENSWSDGQNGIAISLKSSNTTAAPQSVTQDWTMYYNIVRHAAAVNLWSDDSRSGGNKNYMPVHRFLSHDNLYWDIDDIKFVVQSGGGQNGFLFGQIPVGSAFGPFDIWLNHDTLAIGTSASALNTSVEWGGNPNVDYTYGFQIKNSVMPRPFFIGNGDGGGDSILTSFAPGLVATNDCLYGAADGYTYNNAAFNGKQFPANQAAVFVNPGTDFHVSGSSVCSAAASDGLDMGANINALNTATSGVTEALANPVTVTNVSASTFTHLGGTGITITGTNFVNESGLGVIIGGAGPAAAINTDNCSVNTCTVVMTGTISLAVNDTVTIEGVTPTAATNMLGSFVVASVTDNQHFTYTNTGIGTQTATGGTANRNSPGNACTSVSVVSPTSITCTTPAATGTVTTGPVSVFVVQYGIPVQSTVFGNYN